MVWGIAVMGWDGSALSVTWWWVVLRREGKGCGSFQFRATANRSSSCSRARLIKNESWGAQRIIPVSAWLACSEENRHQSPLDLSHRDPFCGALPSRKLLSQPSKVTLPLHFEGMGMKHGAISPRRTRNNRTSQSPQWSPVYYSIWGWIPAEMALKTCGKIEKGVPKTGWLQQEWIQPAKRTPLQTSLAPGLDKNRGTQD